MGKGRMAVAAERDKSLSGLAKQINKEHSACEKAVKGGVLHALECGRLLVEAKAGVDKHGEWLPWLEHHFDGAPLTAERYMKAHRIVTQLGVNSSDVKNLPLCEVLALLSGKRPGLEGPAEPKEPPVLPPGKYRVLYADPPWQYDYSKADNRKIENQYPTLTVEEICEYADSEGRRIVDLPADDCTLFLWATSPKLREAFVVLEAWGFTYRTCMVWVKDKIGMGYHARQKHELLLICTRGNPQIPLPGNRPASVVEAPREEHSKKPVVFHGLIEAMYPRGKNRYFGVELFQRQPRKHWRGHGNET